MYYTVIVQKDDHVPGSKIFQRLIVLFFFAEFSSKFNRSFRIIC